MIKGFAVAALVVLGASQVDRYLTHGRTPTRRWPC